MFAETHNLVANLTKFDASEGFNQVIDFLNGSYLKYALTVNPNIYVSCIKQFWNTVAIKQVNDVTRLQALVDKKKVVVTEAVIRKVLRLDDAEGVDCLPNEEIFTELAKMGYEKPSTKLTFYKAFFSSQWKFLIHTILLSISAKRTSLNEFSSAMAPAVFCLSTGDDIIAHREVPTVTQEPSIPSPTLTIPPSQPPQDIPSTSQVQQTPPQSPQRIDTSDDIMMDDESNQGRMIDEIDKVYESAQAKVDESAQAKVDKSTQEDEPAKVQEVVDVVTTANLITEIVTAASEIIFAAEPQVPTATITVVLVRVVAPSRRWKGVEVEDLKRHLEIVPDKDDDVYTEATSLARKVPVVDYKIIELNNKPYYKIIRADGTHQLYISFLTLLKNFNREDLEALWSLVKERFSTSKPKNFFDDFLLTTLRAMFEKPDVQAQVEKSKDYTWSSKAKLLLLDNAAEARLMLLSDINAAKEKLMLSRQS
nr:hypothetical protein [Tanacetum cinerariifolium]